MTASEQQAEYAARTPTIGKKLRAAIEADVLRRVADEGPVRFAMTHSQPRFRGMNVVDPAWLRAEADRIEEGAR